MQGHTGIYSNSAWAVWAQTASESHGSQSLYQGFVFPLLNFSWVQSLFEKEWEMRFYAIKQMTVWQSCTAEQKSTLSVMIPSCDVEPDYLFVPLHLTWPQSIPIVFGSIFLCKRCWVAVNFPSVCVFQTASLFSCTNSAIFVESAFPSSDKYLFVSSWLFPSGGLVC